MPDELEQFRITVEGVFSALGAHTGGYAFGVTWLGRLLWRAQLKRRLVSSSDAVRSSIVAMGAKNGNAPSAEYMGEGMLPSVGQ